MTIKLEATALIEVATAPLEAVNIMGGEDKKGDWTTDTVTFSVLEYSGETSSYGDFNNNGMAGQVNEDVDPVRSYHFGNRFIRDSGNRTPRYGTAAKPCGQRILSLRIRVADHLVAQAVVMQQHQAKNA